MSLVANNIENSFSDNSDKLNSVQIISNTQLRTDEYFIAEGDVMIQNGGSIIVAEKFEYDYKVRKISLKGNIKFSSKGQFFEASEFNYDLNNKTGFFKDIFWSINFESLDFIKLEKEIDNNINEDVFIDTEIKNVKLNSISTIGLEEVDLKEERTFLKKFASQKFILDFFISLIKSFSIISLFESF